MEVVVVAGTLNWNRALRVGLELSRRSVDEDLADNVRGVSSEVVKSLLKGKAD